MVFCFFVFSRFEPNDFFLSFENFRTTKRKHAAKAWLPSLHLTFEKALWSVAWFYTKTCRRKQPTFWDATIGFPRNEFWATSAFCTTQIWVLHYPYHANSLMTFLFFINCFRKGRERRVEPEGHEPVILRYVYIELHRPPPTERRILYQAKFPLMSRVDTRSSSSSVEIFFNTRRESSNAVRVMFYLWSFVNK